MNKVAAVEGFTSKKAGDLIKAMDTLNTLVDTWAKAPLYGSGHLCDASCTGLCSTGC